MKKFLGKLFEVIVIVLFFLIGAKTFRVLDATIELAGETSVEAENYSEYCNIVKQSINNYDSSIIIKIKDFDKETYDVDSMNNILKANELETLNSSVKRYTITKYDILNTFLKIDFRYVDSVEELKRKEKLVNEKVHEIVKNTITNEMGEYEKEKALYDYLVNNCEYDMDTFNSGVLDKNNDEYSALINGLSMCKGYAQAMNRLLKAANIESKIVIGDIIDAEEPDKEKLGHAWNIVKINGKNYHIDATWDSTYTHMYNETSDYFFNLSDEEIESTRTWKRKSYPVCNTLQ
ncbi:transglutaminase domain-containing protein [Clostridium sp. Marseille-QA1073]